MLNNQRLELAVDSIGQQQLEQNLSIQFTGTSCSERGKYFQAAEKQPNSYLAVATATNEDSNDGEQRGLQPRRHQQQGSHQTAAEASS